MQLHSLSCCLIVELTLQCIHLTFWFNLWLQGLWGSAHRKERTVCRGILRPQNVMWVQMRWHQLSDCVPEYINHICVCHLLSHKDSEMLYKNNHKITCDLMELLENGMWTKRRVQRYVKVKPYKEEAGEQRLMVGKNHGGRCVLLLVHNRIFVWLWPSNSHKILTSSLLPQQFPSQPSDQEHQNI